MGGGTHISNSNTINGAYVIFLKTLAGIFCFSSSVNHEPPIEDKMGVKGYHIIRIRSHSEIPLVVEPEYGNR